MLSASISEVDILCKVVCTVQTLHRVSTPKNELTRKISTLRAVNRNVFPSLILLYHLTSRLLHTLYTHATISGVDARRVSTVADLS